MSAGAAADPCGDTWWHVPDQAPPIEAGDGRPADWEDEGWLAAIGPSIPQRLGSDPGGVLAAAVEDATADGAVADLADTAVVEVAVAAQRLLGWAMGAQLQAVAELARRSEATPLGERAAVEELALACGVSGYTMYRRLDAAVLLPSRLPRVWTGLVSGGLEWAKAWEILDKTMVLTDPLAAAVEEGALAVALTSNLPDLRGHLTRAVAEIDPEGATERARDAHARRGVTFRPGPDATATMALTASAAAVAEAEAALNRLTTAAPHTDNPDSAGHRDGLDRRDGGATRADVLLDLIHTADADLAAGCEPSDAERNAGQPDDGAGRPAPGPERRFARALVQVTIPLSTLLALADHPAELAGYGPIPAAMARELVRDLSRSAIWRCAVTDDHPGRPHGTLVALGRSTFSTAYTPGRATRDFVTTRDGTCRFPGCRQPATRTTTDLDHRVPWRPSGAGGATCDCNLQTLCGNHHRLKHETRFSVSGDPAGVTWNHPDRPDLPQAGQPAAARPDARPGPVLTRQGVRKHRRDDPGGGEHPGPRIAGPASLHACRTSSIRWPLLRSRWPA